MGLSMQPNPTDELKRIGQYAQNALRLTRADRAEEAIEETGPPPERASAGPRYLFAPLHDHGLGMNHRWRGLREKVPYRKPMVQETFTQTWVQPAYGSVDKPSLGLLRFDTEDGVYQDGGPARHPPHPAF